MTKALKALPAWLACLCLLFVQQTQLAGSAPATTHHLKIGVNGDMPTLIVTSAEVGIAPAIPQPTIKNVAIKAITTEATTTAQHDEFPKKPNVAKKLSDLTLETSSKTKQKLAKLKQQQQEQQQQQLQEQQINRKLKLQQQQQANQEKAMWRKKLEKAKITHKQAATVPAAKEHFAKQQVAATTTLATTPTTPATAITPKTTTASATIAIDNASQKPNWQIPTTTETKVPLTKTTKTTTTTAPTTTATAAPTLAYAQEQHVRDEATTLADNLATSKANKQNVMPSVASTTAAAATTTTAATTNDSTVTPQAMAKLEVNQHVMLQAEEAQVESILMTPTQTPTLATTPAQTPPKATKTTAPTTTAKPKTIKAAASQPLIGLMSTSKQVAPSNEQSNLTLAEIESTAKHDTKPSLSSVTTAAITPTTTTIGSTKTSGVVKPTTVIKTTAASNKDDATATATARVTATPSISNIVTTTTEHVGIVKLIDLEKHIGSAHTVAQGKHLHFHAGAIADVGGHDGVKKTKKKQLFDKHFLEDATFIITSNADKPNDDELATTTTGIHNLQSVRVMTTTPPPQHSNMTVASNNIKAEMAQTTTPPANVAAISKQTTLAPKTKSLPAHGVGYLGPIFMAEQILSKPHTPETEHESHIAAQLLRGEIVEIIAPTKLLAATKPATTLTATTTTQDPVADSKTIQSTTVFNVPEQLPSTTHLPVKSIFRRPATQAKQLTDWPTESKISDIQIEVYDSTVDSTIVASTNFKDIKHTITTTKPNLFAALPQERFTQYVIDRTDVSTQDSSLVSNMNAVSGKPEPAAIEIHINVSEAFGNESEDLEFSYRQADYDTNNGRPPVVNFGPKTISTKNLRPYNDASNSTGSKEHNDEILVVEIIDTGENNTDSSSASAENLNPIFTFRADSDAGIELKDIKVIRPQQQNADELFLADVQERTDLAHIKPPQPPPPPPAPPAPIIDRDSDTIFYISNTEVKVGESLPTQNSNEQQAHKQPQHEVETQFYPASYVATKNDKPERHRYEEDIILSPLQNTADALKIFRSSVVGDGAPPPDVTYVGESVIEVEQSAGLSLTTMPPPAIRTVAATTMPPDVIIQPAILPEIAIGVPVIGELPPQIELKEIDFMPDEANQQHSGVYENDIDGSDVYGGGSLSSNGVANGIANNDIVDNHMLESSMQYGGDLIDERVGGIGFDGIEGSYPFANPATMRELAQNHNLAKAASSEGAADYAHYMVQHGVNNFRKDALSVDIAGGSSAETTNFENATSRELADDAANNKNNSTGSNAGKHTNQSSYAAGLNMNATERMSNATALAEDPSELADEELDFLNLFALAIGLAIVILPVALFSSIYFGLRYFLQHKTGSSNNNNNNNDENDTNQANDGKMASSGDGGAGAGAGGAECTAAGNQNESMLPTTTPKKVCFKRDNPKYFYKTTEYEPNPSTFFSTFNECAYANYVPVQQAYPRGPNGSITKMTMKNNHLIVETEERNDISRNARETKMHYNTADKDGVFVVEVSRGIDSKTMPDSPITEEKDLPCSLVKTNCCTILRTEHEKHFKSHEEVLIHQPPAELNLTKDLQRSLHQIDEIDEHELLSPKVSVDTSITATTAFIGNLKTGLSQSDISSTSSTDSNKDYAYGNQELYVIEQPGYDTMSPTSRPLPSVSTNTEVGDDDREPENDQSIQHSTAQAANTAESAKDNKHFGIEDTLDKAEFVQPSDAQDDKIEKENMKVETKAVEQVAAMHDVKKSVEQQINNVEMQINNDGVAEEAKETSTEAVAALEEEKIVPCTEVIAKPLTNGTDNEQQQQQLQNDELVTGVEKEINEDTVHDHDAKQENETNAINELTYTTATAATTADIEKHAIQTETEHGYDSLMNLPAPPPLELSGQSELDDYNSLSDANQLDSLPPPPPPTMAAINDGMTIAAATTATTALQINAMQVPQQQQQTILINGMQPELVNHDMALPAEQPLTPPDNYIKEAKEEAAAVKAESKAAAVDKESKATPLTPPSPLQYTTLPPPIDFNNSSSCSKGQQMPVTLTPPSSPSASASPTPPPSPPAHYANAINNGICTAMPLAVDVNGS